MATLLLWALGLWVVWRILVHLEGAERRRIEAYYQAQIDQLDREMEAHRLRRLHQGKPTS